MHPHNTREGVRKDIRNRHKGEGGDALGVIVKTRRTSTCYEDITKMCLVLNMAKWKKERLGNRQKE